MSRKKQISNTNKQNKYKYNLGIALSGGGAKGFAHLGVMKALYERGIYPDIISGTSAGAFAGVFIADGHDPKEVLTYFEKKTFKEFAELTIPHTGIFKASRFKEFLNKHIKAKTFEELHVPLKTVATDLVNGKSVVFDHGPLIHAITASCAYPIVFTPVEINNIHYVDGGLFKNFPVTPIRTECKFVIGVNVSPLTHQEYKNSLLYVAERSFHYMSVANSVIDRRLSDILIETEALAKYPMFTLEHTREIFDVGYQATCEELDKPQNAQLVKELTKSNLIQNNPDK